MTTNTVLYKNFDPSRVIFSNKINDLNEGGTVTSCKVTYDHPGSGEGRFIMQSAKMRAPFGVGSGEKFNQPDKWSIQLSFKANDKKISKFYSVMEALDECVIKEGIKRYKDIAGQSFDDDDDDTYRKKVIKKGYKSKIKKAKEGTDYPDTFQISIPWDKSNGKPKDYVKFYDCNNEETTWDAAKLPGIEVVCLFEISNIWTSTIGTGSFGMTIRLFQMKICSTPTKISGLQIVADDESDDDDGEHTDANSVDVSVNDTDPIDGVTDEENEDNDDE